MYIVDSNNIISVIGGGLVQNRIKAYTIRLIADLIQINNI